MKILQWAFPYFPTLGGREIFIDRLVFDFHKRGHEVFILSNESEVNSPLFESIPGEYPHERINIAALKNSEDPLRFNKYRDFAVECITKWQPDIIHIHNIYDLGPVLLVESLKQMDKRPQVLLTHHGLAGRELIYAEQKFKYLAPYIDHVVLPSQINLELFKMYTPIPKEKLSLIYNGVPIPEKVDREESAEQYFIYAGRLTFDKGVGVLLASWKLINQRYPHLKLKIAGSGLLEKMLQDFVDAVEIRDSVEFLGWLPSEELAPLLKGSLGVIVPSTLSEPFGLIAAEAQAFGIPVIASGIGGLAEIVVDDKTGFLVPPGDFGSLCKAMDYLIQNPEVRERFGIAAHARMKEIFSLEKSHNEYEKLYKKMIG